jgi:riboflavin biosynthesis pyrimidine reductase
MPACSLVFVQSREGNTGAKDPSLLGGGATDHHLIYEGLSRVAADGVLAGARTIAGGGIVFSVWHPELVALRSSRDQPRHPSQIVATIAGLDLERGLLFNTPEINVFVLTIASAVDAMRRALTSRPWITPIVMNKVSDLQAAFEQLRDHGMRRISAVGGRTLARQLIDAGLVQEIFLTTSPRHGGEPNTPIYPRPLDTRLVLRKRGTGTESGVVFEHWLV